MLFQYIIVSWAFSLGNAFRQFRCKSDFSRKTMEFGRDHVARGGSGLQPLRRRAPVVPPHSGDEPINKLRQAEQLINRGKGYKTQWRLTIFVRSFSNLLPTQINYFRFFFLCWV